MIRRGKLVKDTGPVAMRDGTREIKVQTRIVWDEQYEYQLEIGGATVGFSGAVLLRGIIDEFLRTEYKIESEDQK